MHIVFRYGDLFEMRALYAQQAAITPYPPMGERARMYSTGRLEAALRGQSSISVICSKPVLGSHDDWWASWIPEPCIFLAPSLDAIRRYGLENNLLAISAFPWVRCCMALDISVPDPSASVDWFIDRLDRESWITLGREIPAWNYNRHP